MKDNIKGLTNEEVKESRRVYGSNKLIGKKKTTILKLIIESLNDPIIKILLIALGIKVLMIFNATDLYETIGIAIAIFLSSFISVLSESGSEKAFERLNEENNKIKVKVIRNSNKQIINIEEVVVGDIVILEQGDKVPADSIIINGELSIDESSLTGESKEKFKTKDDKVYMGSIVTENFAVVRVESVGENTFYGKIANDIQQDSVESPLKLKLRDLAKTISKLGYIGAILVFISYFFNAIIITGNYTNIIEHLLYGLTLSVAVVVMAVPEGLPMMITLVLSSNMKRLLNKNVLVRKLIGIETAGSLNILFTDKTGTLTEGKLKVLEILNTEFNKVDIKNDLYNQAIIYNNDSYFINNKIEGSNSTDRAILEYTNNDKKDKYTIIKKEKFNSKKKYSSITTNYQGETTFIKGAYEQIINNSNMYLTDQNTERVLINKKEIIEKIEKRTEEGQRVIGVSYKKGTNTVLLGFIFMKDNIRKEAYESIKNIKDAGVQVVMLTGDSYKTALSISKELNIIDSDKDIILTSDEFNNMSDQQVMNNLNRIKVLCRSLPSDKLRFIKIAQMNNLVVGMTGDGINDAPALKKADVGFAMGSGTEVAKETSDIIILDNNISSIYESILYGRTIFKNIRKFITFQLSVNCCAVLLSIIGPFIGILSPITVIQVLWVNMIMDTLSGLAFSYEPALKEYMKEKPKEKNEKIINSYMKNQIIIDGILSMLICIFFLKSNLIKQIYSYNLSDKYLLTAFFGLFIFLDIFLAFNSRTHRLNILSNLKKNKIFLLIFIIISIIQVILIYKGGELFRTTGLTIYEFEIMIFFAFLIIPIDFIRKVTLKKRHKQRTF